MEPPDAYYKQPEIHPTNQFYWDAFAELSSERQIGMGLGPIPRSAIKAYAEEFAVVGDSLDLFMSIIRRADNEFLRVANSSEKRGDATVPVSDTEGVRGVMQRLQARAKNSPKTPRRRAH